MLGGLGALMLAMVAAGSAMQKTGFFGGLPRENMIGYTVAACGAGLAYAAAVALVRREADGAKWGGRACWSCWWWRR